ncbi:MAG: response regulator [Phycisphaerales bacterium]
MNSSDFTILVCDDETHIRQMVAQKLAAAGFTVREAKNGRQALEAVTGPEQLRPSLVISDFQMPELNGMELCTLLKTTPATLDTPVLMLTARGYVLSRDDLSKTNIREVIAKPFGVRQLLERVRAILGVANESTRAAA